MSVYYPRLIDRYLLDWSKEATPKPILLRGARQVGKSSAVRHLSKHFKNYIEINFEKNPNYAKIFKTDLDVTRIIREISVLSRKPIHRGETLLFLDEIQECPEAIMSLRFFREDMTELHVIAAGSLLEFTLDELPTFGVGRIHSMFMYPMTFDEFLTACGNSLLLEERNNANYDYPLSPPVYDKLVESFRNYLLIGGMPEVVDAWIKNNDYLKCQQLQDDLLISYETDFAKYSKKIDPMLLRNIMRSAALQVPGKFVYTKVSGNYSTYQVKKGLELLIMAGLLYRVPRTPANGLPLGSGVKIEDSKILTLDSGLTLRLLNLSLGDDNGLVEKILVSSASDLVNKGQLAELVAGLEILRYCSPNLRHEIFYWARDEKNSTAEIDYLTVSGGRIIPLEVKAGVQGGMKSLWMFMDIKDIKFGVRSSLENFGKFQNGDKEVIICPLYALSQLKTLISL